MPPSPSRQLNLLTTLVDANKAILHQKLSLLSLLETKFGTEDMHQLFTRVCPIVHASIGQHYRHSMDHIELAALVASTRASINSGTGNIQHQHQHQHQRQHQHNDPVTLRYDLRVRGGTLEKDVNATRKRIQDVMDIFQNIDGNNEDHTQKSNVDNVNNVINVVDQSVKASFMLSSESDSEMELESTIGRELGFCAHHAIHHLAMVKVIAVQTIGLKEGELPDNFGKAPSTTRFEVNQ